MKIHLIYQKAREKIFIYFFNMLPSRAAHPPLVQCASVKKHVKQNHQNLFWTENDDGQRGEKDDEK